MKVILVLAAIGSAVAQNLAGQPACATACIVSAIGGSGCGADNLACQCGVSQAAIAASAAPCIIQSCTAAGEINQAQSAGLAACASFHATAYITSNTTASATSNGATTASATAASTNGGSRTSATTRTTTSATNAASVPIAKGAGVGGVIAFLGALLAL